MVGSVHHCIAVLTQDRGVVCLLQAVYACPVIPGAASRD
jgi:hypothetical protein